MADLRDLYQQLILEHYKKPRNFRKPEHSNRQAQGFNPLCGDKFDIYLYFENGAICDIGFMGTGCAISIASASMMTETLKGKTAEEADIFIDRFFHMLDIHTESANFGISMGDLDVFLSVRGYPVRIKCATLAWHAARAALHSSPEIVTTQ
jgi:nitrogen fixation protein NifU and related proteins